MDERTIHHGQPWHLGHDESGKHYIGPVHPDCNLEDARKRGILTANGQATRPDVSGWFA
ncbi:MAG TPA: hypothetical protein VNN79_06175 [Actinomycetota bacterium]|nr:hypothetical protein [Actinomycetota bacterium]